MKHSIIKIILLLAGTGLFVGCNETRTLYDGPASVLFADALSVCPVTADGRAFQLSVASLASCDYDRTYHVESIGSESNAVEGFHYTLNSHTVTIPAGKTAAQIDVQPIYEHIGDADSLGFRLRLHSPRNDAWSEQGSTTKVRLQKVCPFEPHDLVGYCRVYSPFLNKFTGKLTRDITCRLDDQEPDMLVFEDFYDDGFDLRIRVDNSDPLNPRLELPEDQCIADIRHFMQKPHGDNMMMATDVPGTVSTIDFCKRMGTLYLYYYVKDIGYVGAFENLIRWFDEGEM